jgi:hypothetical protein
MNCVLPHNVGALTPDRLPTSNNSGSMPVTISYLASGRAGCGMDVIKRAKKVWHRWQLFKEIEPGHRFQTATTTTANAANVAKRGSTGVSSTSPVG